MHQLGPTTFFFAGKHFQRIDFELINPRNMKIHCSLWEPTTEDRPCPTMPCVIYMHGNSSSRLESLSALSMVLAMGASLLAFDFSGSGLSDGDYVSLGAYEKDDLDKVVAYLRESGKVSTIALWGRSMGASTALLHGDRDPSIAGMVLDSAFADLVMLAEELVEKGRQQGLFAPNFMVKMAISFIRSSVQKTANFDIKHLSPIANADKCFIPAVFVCGISDSFVSPNHSRKIYEKYGGDKNLVEVEGDHNTPRPKYLYDSIAIFLQSVLQVFVLVLNKFCILVMVLIVLSFRCIDSRCMVVT
jgi:pimeloyl-ACP methyl ester carboxylesterase